MRNRLLNLLAANANRGEFRAEGNTLFLYDFIVSSEDEARWMGGVAAETLAKTLAQLTGPVNLRINSPGGDAFAGVAIAQAIRAYKDGVTTYVDGMAASAASTVAIAGDKVVMAPGSMLMIHNAWTIALGDKHDFKKTADFLDKVDGEIAAGYAAKAGGDRDFAALMDAETWFTAEEAIAAGLADQMADSGAKAKDKAAAAAWDVSAYKAPPALVADAPELAPEPITEPMPAVVDQVDAAATESEQRQRQLTARLLAPAA